MSQTAVPLEIDEALWVLRAVPRDGDSLTLRGPDYEPGRWVHREWVPGHG